MNISKEALVRLRAAKHVMVFTGAGVSAESGIPTFRDTRLSLSGLAGEVLPDLISSVW